MAFVKAFVEVSAGEREGGAGIGRPSPLVASDVIRWHEAGNPCRCPPMRPRAASVAYPRPAERAAKMAAACPETLFGRMVL